MITYIWPPQSVSVSVPPLEFFLNGTETPVSRDTATPANSNPLPVIQLGSDGSAVTPLTDTQLRATAVPVSGPLTDAELRATPVPISGTVTANTGLSQPLTDTELRATPVPVSGTVTANTGLSQPLTDAQLRATPVPVSGTVTANTGLSQPLTDTELRATAVPVSVSSLPLPSGAATSALQTSTEALIGAVTETPPASDTASSGLNGRLQRIAQRITSLIALLPASIGQKIGSDSLSVVLASDQSAIQVTQTVQAMTPKTAKITVGVTAVRATHDGAAPDAGRILLMIKPYADNSGKIYLGGSDVTAANGLEIIGPDRIERELDSAEYYLISDTAGQFVEILEKE